MRSVVNTAKILLTYFIYKNRGATEETGVTTFFGIRLSVNIFIIIIARQRKHKIKINKLYLEVINYQLFVVNTVEKWMGIICGFKESEDLTISTCFYVQMWGLVEKNEGREEK